MISRSTSFTSPPPNSQCSNRTELELKLEHATATATLAHRRTHPAIAGYAAPGTAAARVTLSQHATAAAEVTDWRANPSTAATLFARRWWAERPAISQRRRTHTTFTRWTRARRPGGGRKPAVARSGRSVGRVAAANTERVDGFGPERDE